MHRILFGLLFMVVLGAHGSEVRLDMGKKLEKSGDIDGAIREYQNQIIHSPGDDKALAALAHAYLLKKDYGRAETYYQKAFKVNPLDEYQAGITMAQKYHVPANTPKSTSETAKSSVESDDFAQAKALTEANKNEEALELWRKVLQKNPHDAGAYYYAGVARYNLKQYDKAITNLTKGQNYPEMGHNSWYFLGLIAQKQNKKAEAIKNFKTYLAKTTSEKGRIQVKKILADLGVKDDQVATKAAPTSAAKLSSSSAATPASSSAALPKASGTEFKVQALPSGHLFAFPAGNVIGANLLQQAFQDNSRGLGNQAIETLKQINRDYPDSPASDAARFNLMSLYADLGLNDKVITVGDILLERGLNDPIKSGVLYLMSEAAYNSKRAQEASDWIGQVHSGGVFGPSEAQRLELHGKLMSRKDQNASLDQLKQAVLAEVDPLKKASLEIQVAKQLNKSKSQEALIYYKSAVSHCNGQNTDVCRKAVYGVADVSYRLHQWKDAEESYHQGIRTYPDPNDSPWALFQIGNIYREQGRYNDAISTYDQLVKEYSSSRWADQAKWRRDDVVWRQQHPGLIKN